MTTQLINQIALEAEGVPEDLAILWAELLSGNDSPARQLAHGLYRYFVGPAVARADHA